MTSELEAIPMEDTDANMIEFREGGTSQVR